MKKYISILCLFFTLQLTADSALKSTFIVGDPGISSINSMTFGPESILFIGDSKTGMVYALDLADQKVEDNSKVSINKVDQLLADMLGSASDQIQITDLAVDPANQNIYLSVHHSSGKPMLFKVTGSAFTIVNLEKVSHDKSTIDNVVAEDAKDRRGRSLRNWAVSDIGYFDGKVMVSGLSNKEFGSTFRQIPFPFGASQDHASLEIYHAAHGKYETASPIKTFLPTTINGKKLMMAGYTCTPLVLFPIDELKKGAHTKGRTVAELGNWNTPLDIIEMNKDGKSYFLIANSARALMKISADNLMSFQESLTEPVLQRSGTAGVAFINLPFVNVQQLAQLDDKRFLMLQRDTEGNLLLKTGGNRWL